MNDFPSRHIGLSTAEADELAQELGYPNAETLVRAAVPDTIETPAGSLLDLPPGMNENQALARMAELAAANVVATSCIGQGWYDTHTPAVIRRNMIENPAWYTAYTPYQPEISQGRLEMLAVFQTMVADLTGCELASASLLDEATAAAEAMTMLDRLDRRGERRRFFVDQDCYVQTKAVVAGRAEPLGIEIVTGPAAEFDPEGCFGALLAYPGASGQITDLRPLIEAAHQSDTRVAVATDLLACTLLIPPGELGADLVVGSAQRFGVPLGFGGPNAGFMATSQNHARQLPGRLVGVSVDANGGPAYRLALQTREQHIRREKATSNICTAQALLANVAAAYGCWWGPEGLTAIAQRTHGHAADLADWLNAAGLEVTETCFDTVTVRTDRAAEVITAAANNGINLWDDGDGRVGISFDETTTTEVVERIAAAFRAATNAGAESVDTGDALRRIPAELRRTSPFMTDERFSRFQTETEMLRWLRSLADKDLALDRTMIPLGSCTMKLNAAAEMEPITWPQFAGIHPYAPADQTQGYRQLIGELEQWLCTITGYDKVSLQPNAGSQGEYAGLLAIRRYHQDNHEAGRDICLIPSSAHGTNAASAVLAGLRVVVVACDDQGNVDVDDLKAKLAEHGDTVAALMITYPSTHGVYEEQVTEICELVHAAGGQVYTDGANLNALVGLAEPGSFGSDVSHLNLHKTFCIPHGGGGPGVGPVAVREHLAPYLPGHPVITDCGPAQAPVSAAPWGSAGILPISWAYIAMMGPDGLLRATIGAVTAANYLAKRLSDHYPILYQGPRGLVAHECIVDLRPITSATGVSADDVAKRLADYGFHAPTMSFPVAGTLMIEPTESESRRELDRFVAAMAAIRHEINDIEAGRIELQQSPLRHAPHTVDVLLADGWDRTYSRTVGAYGDAPRDPSKYFPPVGRVDNAFGDRNLACTCPPLEDLAVG